jgi:hypothetical protein
VRAAAICVAFAATLSLTQGARAQGASAPRTRDVRIGESTCGEVPWTSSAWIDLLRAELAADGIVVRGANGATDANATEAPRVSVTPSPCAGTATSATLTFSAGSVRRTREVRLGDAEPIARPRVLAIAMAELVRSALSASSSESDRDRDRAPAAEVDVRIHLEQPLIMGAPIPEARSSSAAVFVAAEARTFPAGGTALFGGRAGLLVPLGDSVALVADGGVLRGSAHDALGDIDATVVTLGAALLGTGHVGSVMLGVGPRFEGGLAWLSGDAAAATTAASTKTTGLVLVAMTAMASFQIRPSWSGVIALDAGTSLYGFHGRADERNGLELIGPMLAMRIGFARSAGGAPR